MKKFGWLFLMLILTLVPLLAPATAQAPDETGGLASAPVVTAGNWFIVEFEDPSLAVHATSGGGDVSVVTVGGKLNVSAPASQVYIGQLRSQQAAFTASLSQVIRDARVERGYQIVLNAVAVELPNSDLETLNKLWTMPGVKRVSPQRIYTVDMDYSLPLVNASALWSQLDGRDAAGAGIKVAVVDTGIDPDHPLFDGTGWLYPTTGTWPKGYCANHGGFCNGKIIAARYYTPTFEVDSGESLTPQDYNGHGSHTAGTSAGNRVTASYGTATPEISGVAPGAWIMAYKGLFLTPGGGGSGSNIMLAGAVEDAIADGADVINNSWGSSTIVMPENDPLIQAYEAAADAGIVVVFSTGNAGPGYNTAGSPTSPKFIEVGASTTERFYANEVAVTAPTPVTDILQSIPANEFADTRPITTTIGPLTVIKTDDDGHPLITPTVSYGDWIALIPKVYGMSWSTVKLDNAEAAGAVTAVMWPTGYPGSAFDYNWVAEDRIPCVMVEHDMGEELSDWWDTYTDTVELQMGVKTPFTTKTPDVIASFSSRGPHVGLSIKPDLVAPGVNILSGISDSTYVPWDGTSMSAPHVTGAAALLLQLHPTWTPVQVKSALMSTASQTVLDTDETTTADVMTQGAGRIDLSDVGDPGLTFDKPSHSFGMVSQGSSDSERITAMDVSGADETYSLSVQEMITDTGNVTVTVTPASLNMTAGGSGSFTVTVKVGAGASVQDLEGNIVISGTSHTAHIPYWLRVYEDTGAEVLLVDFDESEATAYGYTTIYGGALGDYTGYYTSTLQALGVTYDYWNVWDQLSPPRSVLDQYDKVVVYSGDYGGFLLLGSQLWFGDSLDSNDFRNYLAAGGKLIFSGQEALGDFYHQYHGLGDIDPLASYMRGAADAPLKDGIFPAMPPQPSVVGLEDFNPFLKDVALDLSIAGDGAGNQYAVDEVAWLNYVDLDTWPLFEVVNTVTDTVESGYVATRSSYEPTIERVNDPIGLPNEPVSWRVAFLAFGLEGVNDDTGYTTREQLLDALFDWLDDEVTVAFNESSYFVPADFGSATFSATMTSTPGADAVSYRWDFGDRTGIAFTTDATISHQYLQRGLYWARVEAMDEYGHKAVSAPVLVTVGYHFYMPIVFQNYPCTALRWPCAE